MSLYLENYDLQIILHSTRTINLIFLLNTYLLFYLDEILILFQAIELMVASIDILEALPST